MGSRATYASFRTKVVRTINESIIGKIGIFFGDDRAYSRNTMPEVCTTLASSPNNHWWINIPELKRRNSPILQGVSKYCLVQDPAFQP